MNRGINKKSALREHFLKYAKMHAVNNRIPTVRELRQALGCSNYMLLNCMNDLIREGVLYRKSRKEGTYLADDPSRYVIGLLMEGAGRNDYLEQPGWMSGFCRAFMGQRNFFVRFISLMPNTSPEIPIRKFGLSVLVARPELNMKNIPPQDMPEELRRKIIFSLSGFNVCFDELPQENTLAPDREYWPREYVRAALRRGCKQFVLLGQDDFVNEVMIDEMHKQGMAWEDECRITNPGRISQSLKKLIGKYPIDAIRCGGAYEPYLAEFFRNNPSFRPFLPVLDQVKAEGFFGDISPAVPYTAIFETPDLFMERAGWECGIRAMELAQTGKTFPSVRMKIKMCNNDLYAGQELSELAQ